MPIFSNITNLPTYSLNRNSNPLLQNEPPRNRSSAEQQNIAPGSSPINDTLQYPTHSNTPYPPIRGCSVAPPPSPTLSIRGFPPAGPYHVNNDEEDPNDIRYSPVVPTTNPTRHSSIAEDVITQSDLDIGTFQYAWRVPPYIVLRTTRGHYFKLQEISGTLKDPIPVLLESEAHHRNPFEFQPPSQQPPPIVKVEDDKHTHMHLPAGATSIRQPTPFPVQHVKPTTTRFSTITAPATPAIPIPSALLPAYFISMPNNATQPIAPEYTEYTNPILHHLENLTMSYGRNPKTSLPIGEYIRQIEAQQLAQETTITNLVTSLRATREAIQNQVGQFCQVLDAGRHLEEQLDQ
ncbi:hypothetical protein AX16_009104 [Volvariella volvacea WC 439]|nr:hypothetical protein AX16_009104 [Volvariella volvacea WC 439]